MVDDDASACHISAIDPGSHAELWSSSLPIGGAGSGDVDSSLALSCNGTLYALGEHNQKLTAIDTIGSSHNQIWTADVPGDITGLPLNRHFNSSPAIDADGTIYVGGGQHLHAINPSTGANKWSFPSDSTRVFQSSPAIGLDTVYIGGESSVGLFAVDSAIGALKWSFSPSDWSFTKDVLSSPAVAADGTIYICMADPDDNKATLFAILDLGTTGVESWRIKLDGQYTSCSPCIGPDGTVFIADSNKVYAVVSSVTNSPLAPPANSPWPMYHHDAQHTGLGCFTPSCTTFPTNAIAWWPLNGNADDIIEQHTSTLITNVGISQGQVGRGLVCRRKDGGVTVPDNWGLNFSTGDFSITAWVRPETASTDYGVMNIVDKRDVAGDTSTKGYEMYLVDGQLGFQMSDDQGGPQLGANDTTDLRDGNWHFVAITVDRDDPSGGKLYVDGSLVQTFDPTAAPGDMTTTGIPLLIGIHPSSYLDCNFRGGLDEVAVYQYAIDSTSLGDLYAQGQAGLFANLSASGLWSFEGNANDTSFNGNNGTLFSSSEASFVAGKIGPAMYLQGGSVAGVLVEDRADLDFGSGVDFTIEAWVRPESASTSYGVMDIVDKRETPDDSHAKGYEFCLSGGQLTFQMSDSVSTSPLGAGGGPDLRNGAWHHVAVTVQRGSSTGGHLYVDGTSVATFNPTSKSGSLGTTGTPLLIGMHPSPWLDCNFRGGIDEVTMFKRALTSTEIAAEVTAGYNGRCFQCVDLPTNAIAWWPTDTDATDIVLNHTSTLVRGHSFVSAQVNDGLKLTGRRAGVSVPNSWALNFSTFDFSVSAWFKADSTATWFSYMPIIDKGLIPDETPSKGYALYVVDGQLSFQMADDPDGSRIGVTDSTDLRDNTWHCVVISVTRSDSSGGKMYLDGSLVQTFDPTGAPGDTTTPDALLIGMHPLYQDYNFQGVLDEVAVYGFALDETSAASICSSGVSSANGYWPLNDNAQDSSGVGNHGTILSPDFSFVLGKVGPAIKLEGGTGTGISVADAADLNFGAGTNFTIEGWVRPESVDTSYGVMDIVDKRDTPNDYQAKGYEFCLIGGQLGFQMSDSLGSYPLVTSGGPDLRDGSWHHVAVTVDRASSSGGKLYVDGAQVGSSFNPTTKSGSLGTTGIPLLIGMHPSPWLDCNFSGELDEITMYKRALTATEIQTIYNVGNGGKCK